MYDAGSLGRNFVFNIKGTTHVSLRVSRLLDNQVDNDASQI